jgi:ABC-2 type transport system ATP-binding protein
MTETDAGTAIDADGLVKSFGDVRALDGFDIRVESGQIHGLVGPNGAGKTTLLRVLFGLVAREEGSLTVLGREVGARGSTVTTSGVGGFVEEPRFYPYLSARRNLQFLCDLDGGDRDRVDEVLVVVGLGDQAKRKVGGFSSGMRQRLGIAASLLRAPRLLLLDEPTVGLDPSGTREMLRVVRGLAAEGVTVLVCSHNMAELEGVCDGVTVMKEGRSVWHGSMQRLRDEAPAPAYRMWTSADERALERAASNPEVRVAREPDGLSVSADPDDLDAYVISLGRAGVAVRRLEFEMSSLESMFFALTGERPERTVTVTVSDEVGAVL